MAPRDNGTNARPTYVVPGTEPVIIEEAIEPVKPVLESQAAGWNPYRGTEAHGVPAPPDDAAAVPPDDWRADVEDDAEITFAVPHRDVEPVPMHAAWDPDPTVLVTGYTALFTLATAGVTDTEWVQVAGRNPRRKRLLIHTTSSSLATPRWQYAHSRYAIRNMAFGNKAHTHDAANAVVDSPDLVLFTQGEVWMRAHNSPGVAGIVEVYVTVQSEVETSI